MDTPETEGRKAETSVGESVVVVVTGLDLDSVTHSVVRNVDSDRLVGDGQSSDLHCTGSLDTVEPVGVEDHTY